ncbi:hypothetical protein ABH935_001545 [Catenulispora sp. GAS73]|uniref:hypothetical protein n=1 Tax=Catenulispora sp. GAS73 TaxID=3156269 RepID=UPI00351168B5
MTRKTAATGITCTMAVTAILVAACSSGAGHPAGGSTEPPVSSTPAITDPAALALPIDAYKITNDQYQKIDAATIAVEISCMKRYGFDYGSYVVPSTGPNGPDQNARRYGVVDPAVASQYGYHPHNPPQSTTRPPVPKMSDVMFSVLGSGAGPHVGLPTPATYNGVAVPKGGCVGEAENKLDTGGTDIGLGGVVQKIGSDGFNHSLSDDRVKAAFAAWSSCMQAVGYTYATPNDAANDPNWHTESVSTSEIATATADVRCKQKTNVIGIWFAVESAYEQQMIEQHAPELAQVKKNIDDALKRADAAVGAS